MKIKEFLLQKVNKDTLKKESVQRAIKVTICCAFIFALIIQLVGCLFSPLSVYAEDDDNAMTLVAGTYSYNSTLTPLLSINDVGSVSYELPFISSVSFGGSSSFTGFLFVVQIQGDVAISRLEYNGSTRPIVYYFDGYSFGWTTDDFSSSTVTIGDIVVNETIGAWFIANTNYNEVNAPSCPTLPELLRDYTGSFDSIVDMLNSTNYDQYEETIRFYEERAYNEGVSASFGENLLGATFNAPLTALNQWVLFETTGGLEITMGGVFSGLLALSILIILIKMFAGG